MFKLDSAEFGYGMTATATDDYGNTFTGVIVGIRRIGSFDGVGYWRFLLRGDGAECFAYFG